MNYLPGILNNGAISPTTTYNLIRASLVANQAYVGQQDETLDTAAIDALIAAVPLQTDGGRPHTIQVRGDIYYNGQINVVDKRITFDGNNQDCTFHQFGNPPDDMFHFRTAARGQVSTPYNADPGHNFNGTPIVGGTYSFTHIDIPALIGIGGDWEGIEVGDYVQVSGANDPRTLVSNNNNDAHYGQPMEVESIEGDTIGFKGMFREDIPLNEDGDIHIHWVRTLKNVGLLGVRVVRGDGVPVSSATVRLADCQNIRIENCEFVGREGFAIYASFDGNFYKNKTHGSIGFGNAGARVSYGCCDLTFEKNNWESTGNVTDGAGGLELCHHDRILFLRNKMTDLGPGTTSAMRAHASGGGVTWQENEVYSNNKGSQGYGGVAQAPWCNFIANKIWHFPDDNSKAGINIQSEHHIVDGNVIRTNAGGIIGTSGKCKGALVRGNTIIGINGGDRATGSGIGFGNNTTGANVTANTVINTTKGINFYNNGGYVGNHRAYNNNFKDVAVPEGQNVGTPGLPEFQNNVVLENVVTVPLSISDPQLPGQWPVNVAIDAVDDAIAVGGEEPYVYTMSGEPVGLVIDSASGEITGSPSVVSSGVLTVTVTDDNSDSVDSLPTPWEVVSAVVAFLVDPITPPAPWESGVSIPTITVTASGSKLPYFFSVIGLPRGITIDSSTGVISGTHTSLVETSGTFIVTVQAANGDLADSDEIPWSVEV